MNVINTSQVTEYYLVLCGVESCFSQQIAIWLRCGCVRLWDRKAVGVAGTLTRPICRDNRRKLHHLIAVTQCQHLFLQFACLGDNRQCLLHIICWNGSWSLGAWVPWRFCIVTPHTWKLATNNACLEMAFHNTMTQG